MIPHTVLGARSGSGVYLVDSGFRDGVATFSLLAESLPLAPGGLRGEALFEHLTIALEHTMATTLNVTPIVDGTEYSTIPITLTAETERARKTFDLTLSRGIDDASGTESFRMPLRGTWIVLRFEADVADGDLVLERVELDVTVVDEAREDENAA